MYGKLLEQEIDRINSLDINEGRQEFEKFPKEFRITTDFAEPL